ncbi:DUF362 domain-containing protein [Desulfonema magnum]|uniref:DUF362 n=1 Tax=Desulfonema magnum TaxID=45655 RepID=A0A975BS34_9BACT|nr:DUF362 domain-containing protein [Desulfonema magnum]QTA90378.1 DUF362 [Desulfonema magnum]
MNFATTNFLSYQKSVPDVLDKISAKDILSKQHSILIKPNLVNSSPFPVTTSVKCCEAIVNYIKASSDADIVIAEGAGDATHETYEIFDLLGYTDLAERQGIELADLNHARLRKLENKARPVFLEMYLPEIAFTHFIISVPVLKAHSLAVVTGTLKNMMGLAPPRYYSGQGPWKKALFHERLHEAIIDLNTYRSPDLSVMDASVGLADFHLGGRECSPPAGKLIAGFDPLETDREAANLLGIDWKTVPHLSSDLQLQAEALT